MSQILKITDTKKFLKRERVLDLRLKKNHHSMTDHVQMFLG